MVEVRKWVTVVEEIRTEMGRADGGPPLRKAAACAVVRNPHAGRYVEDLSDLVEASRALGEDLCRRAAAALGAPVESYGKGAIVGVLGDQEHAVALLTTVFGDVVRRHAGGGRAWIPSMTKRGGPGERLDVPLAYKDALYVRSHYDGITVAVPDAPAPDEIVVVAAYASRGRINARLGGLRKEEVAAGDGLR
jgi:hypothetical protein